MENNMENLKVNPSTLIKGHSEINHQLRVRLGLGFIDYCIIDYLDRHTRLRYPTRTETIWKYLGLTKKTFDKSLNFLMKKGYVARKKKDNNIYVTDKYKNIDADYIHEEFEKFWFFNINGNKKELWRGPKPMARKMFRIARRSRSFDYIMDQKTWYYKLLQIEKYRQIMRADKFLNIETGQIDENFKDQVLRYNEEAEENKPKQLMNKNDYNLAYGIVNE